MALNWTGGLLFASEDDDFYWTSIVGWPGHHVTQHSYLFSHFFGITKNILFVWYCKKCGIISSI